MLTASEVLERARQERKEQASAAAARGLVLVRPPSAPYEVDDWMAEMEEWPEDMRELAAKDVLLAEGYGWETRQAQWSAYRTLRGGLPLEQQPPLPDYGDGAWLTEMRSWPACLLEKARQWTKAYRTEGLEDDRLQATKADHMKRCSWQAYLALRGRLGNEELRSAALPPVNPPGKMVGTLLIVDVPNVAWRLYHAAAGSRKDDPVPELVRVAVRAVVGSIRAQALAQNCGFVAVAFDAGDGGRSSLYPAYKTNRTHPAGTEGLIDACRDALKDAGFVVLEAQGFEADDVIATVTKMATELGLDVIISSNDKDLRQLVNSQVKIYDAKQKALLGPAEVESRFGVPPALLGDYLAMVGDSADKVKGVQGIGHKTASELLQKYGSLEGVLTAAAEMRGKRGEALVEQAGNARIAREVVRLRDTPMALSFEQMAHGGSGHG